MKPKKKKQAKGKNYRVNSLGKCRCVKRIPTGTIPISFSGITRKKFKEFLILCWTLSPQKVKDAFRPIFKRDIDESDFTLLRKHHKLNMDEILYGENFKRLLGGIRFDHSDMKQAERLIICSSHGK